VAINRKELFEEIQSTYGHVLRRPCFCHSPSREITEELYQEALTNIYQTIPTYRGEAPINTWAYRITLNTCLKSYQGTKGIKLVGLDDIESITPCEQSLEEKTDLRFILDFASNFTLIDRELI
jgi:DNA-directed RNA polymerase specialized sigma24 family protein